MDIKSTSLLKLGIPHATSNFMFWGCDEMGLGVRFLPFANCSSLKTIMVPFITKKYI
jgi:hypothetical protein